MRARGGAALLLLLVVAMATGEKEEEEKEEVKPYGSQLLKEEGERGIRAAGQDSKDVRENKRMKEEGKGTVRKKKGSAKETGGRRQKNKGQKRVKGQKNKGQKRVKGQKNKGQKRVKEQKRVKGQLRKVCAGGRCVKEGKLCKSGRLTRAANCGAGVCCLPGSKKKKQGEERKRKNCKARPACTELSGKCEMKNVGCAEGLTAYRNMKGKKYCKGGKCVCCAKMEESSGESGESGCTINAKCSKKKGYCTTDQTSCMGKIKKNKSFCSGPYCVCCLPPKPCKPQYQCNHLGGTCGNLKTIKCETKPLVGRDYCKGKECGCCVPKEGGGGEGEAPKWGYIEENGPATWPANFAMCGGKRQSPVALVSKEAEGSFPFIPFKFEHYREIPTSSLLINNGHTAMVLLEQEKMPALLGGDLESEYTFLQFHFHWGKDPKEGSEHTIDGRSFPGEIHLVHFKTSYGNVAEAAKHEDGIAVLGIMLEISYTDNDVLSPIINGLAKIHKAEEETEIPPFPLQNLLPKNVKDFFRYEGSLTTPTCNEIVIWTVFKDTIKISHKQLAQFRFLMDDHGNKLIENFRPVQPLNGREVLMGRRGAYWSYIPPFDPPNWPKNFPTCGSKVRQSPVALVSADAIGKFPRLTLGFKNYNVTPEGMVMMNNGHTAQIISNFNSYMEPSIQGGDLDGKYIVLQFHFHWGATDKLGSEHTIDGKKFPLELHIVHYKEIYGTVAEAAKFGDGVAVLGIMFTVTNEDNPNFDPIIEKLSEIHEAEEEAEVSPFPLQNLLPEDTDDFFRYEGSLTTPTCNEIVIWIVFRKTVYISHKQLAEFRKLMDDGGMILQNNFRKPQPLNGREVLTGSLKPHWSYRGATGPDNWASIYPGCKGYKQSPIALESSSSVSTSLPPLIFTNYEKVPTNMTIMNNGHTAQLVMNSKYLPQLSGGDLDGYTFLQLHFHWCNVDGIGSEHTIDGKRFPAELHLVHYKTSYGSVAEAVKHEDGIAVLGIMLESTDIVNPNLQNIIHGLPKIEEPDTETYIKPFAIKDLLPDNTKNYFRYMGSLTTPTCNEIVIWTVFKTPITIARAQQLEIFRKLMDESGLPLGGNFRPLQELNGRKVYMT